MTDDDYKKGILSWLEKQGYPLEMQVSRTLLEIGIRVRQGWYYSDPDTNDIREIDIIASDYASGSKDLLIQAIIECKYSKTPIVAFSYQKGLLKSPIDYWVASNDSGSNFINSLRNSTEKEKIPLFASRSPIAYSLKQALIDNDNKSNTKKNSDVGFESLISVTKASFSLATINTKYPSINPENNKVTAYIGIPVIVFKAPIYSCYLDVDNKIACDPVEEILLEWSYPRVGTLMIRVISDSKVREFGSEIRKSTEVIKANMIDENIPFVPGKSPPPSVMPQKKKLLKG